MRMRLAHGSIKAMLLAASLALAGVTPALAQNDPISSLFHAIFGGQQKAAPPPPVAPTTPAVKPRRAEPAEPKIIELPKNPDAQAILVIGDEQASNLATGLQIAFADTPSIMVVDKSRSGSGLVRDGGTDWPTRLKGLLADRKYDFIAVMIGENDRATFPASQTGGKSEDVRSDKWEALYRDKVRQLDQALKDSGKPFFWVGLPPMERPSLSAFASYLNGIYKQQTEQVGGVSIDSWNGFVDEEGHFDYQGPDVDGQMKRLRAYDGAHFTRAGQRKLAFYVETEIRKIMRGEVSAPEAATPEIIASQPKAQEAMLAAPPPLPPAPWNRVGPVIPLGGAEGSDTELAGPPQSKTDPAARPIDAAGKLPGGYPVAETPLYARVIAGDPIASEPGRADDFTWKQQ